MNRRHWLRCASLGLLLGFTSPARAEAKKKILLVSQGPDGHPPETHEYAAGLRMLAPVWRSRRTWKSPASRPTAPGRKAPT